jgi:multidrug efflux pump subunit AcrA (membrane-fusion protein)
MERAIAVTGTLAAYDQATVGVKVPGRVQRIEVDLGTVVKQGQLIAQLDPQDYQLQFKQADAALAQARARIGLTLEGGDDQINVEDTGTVRQARAVLDESKLKYERAKALFAQGVISRAQLDAAEAELKVSMSRYQDAVEEIRNRQALVRQRTSELEIARQHLADLSIYAPFDGVIQEKRTSIGEYLAAGSPVVSIVRTDPLRLRAEVPEREARSVKQGQLVKLTVEGDTNTYTGKIARLSPTITAQNRILVVEAEVRNNGQLRPGSFARAEIIVDTGTPSLAVPVNSIVTFAGIEKIITIQDGKALEKPITTGRRSGEWVEVLSGIKSGETVIIEPGNLQSGQPVSVVPTS